MKRIAILTTLAVVACGAIPCGGAEAQTGNDNQGFIYGRVQTESGTEYTGFLRWGKEEAFWDDLFHSLKTDLPYRDEVDPDDVYDRKARRGGRIRIFGKMIAWESGRDDDGDANRIFISRFGDIARIEVTGSEEADIHMKNGSVFAVRGYANDVSGTILVHDQTLGEIDLRWNRIEEIEFMPAPRGADPGVTRLHGILETDAGDFEGFIQWDKEECLSTDLLDGEAEDGDVSIAMGRIRSIERRGRNSAIVELRDGRTLRLRGTNDVNGDNRGIMVEDSRYGRLTVPWSEFNKLTLSDPGSSGRGYDDFKKEDSGRLMGTVIDDRGKEYRGAIILDLDESEGWEMLNGFYREIKVDIPLMNVVSMKPQGYDRCIVELRSGETLRLEDATDVSEDNDGILVFTDGDRDPAYLHWKDVAEIRLDH